MNDGSYIFNDSDRTHTFYHIEPNELARAISKAFGEADIITVRLANDPPLNEKLPLVRSMLREQGIDLLVTMTGTDFYFRGIALRLSAIINYKSVIRSLTFPPEYKQAGLAILNYFGRVISDKYPDSNVGITIEQQGSKVTLIIATPEGEEEHFEQEFESYALMVQGKLPPEEYFDSQIEVLAWKQKYEITALELRLTKELKDVQIGDLKQQVQFLGLLITQNQSTQAELVATIREISRQASATTQSSFDTILEVLDRGFTAEDADTFQEALQNIQQRDKNAFQRLVDFINISAASGAIGNYFHEGLKEILKRLQPFIPQ